ncbi:hypothetical protein FRACYDRAFT_243079 [Fragilariopsis cylindrus CCMP1102]|uniref:Uncharacterized protein n=1 Tax=Fragilariopsis cylindrus CCMP1102 TaxID=635003 RepID=A0A1E7F4V6_9STRA|nr:hypothetical protein FRACYDRAFT_243079 [Fragilariopsis cylindrus CCMP1102]|eukprot:OEU13179.1 hypothetical protein FRACYDRAFT_243079 [Fragilariopsis cylindrus CCMP1102]
MGKQGRKKQRQKRKQQLRDDPISTVANDANDAGAIVNPHSAVQKLRNPDPKIRHSALVALQASVISQLNCSSRPINIKVLQAVREQVTSNDLECSAVAADCLAQYLSVTSTMNSKKVGSTDEQQQQHKETTASWALVLLGRLDDCRKALLLISPGEQGSSSALLPQSKNQIKKREKIRKQWYAVSAPCFRALCSLIEDNGPALDRINLQKKTFVEVIFGMLSLEVVVVQTTTTTAEMMTDNVATTTEEEDQQRTANSDAIAKELWELTSLYAARCLHSALDDNYELAEVLQHSDNCHAWKTLLSTSTNNTLSNTTKLHLLGCLVNLYQLSYDPDNNSNNNNNNDESSSSWQEDLLLDYGIASSSSSSSSSSSVGLLFMTLFGNGDDSQQQLGHELATLEMEYRTAKVLFETQNEDQRLEEEIDAKVRERKEPAKDIARRQKINKDIKRKDFQEKQKAKMIADAEKDNDDDNDDDDMMMDVVEEEEKAHSGKIIREQNGEEAMNEALGKWNEKIGQIQLALEIVTNLVSTWIVDDNEDDDCDNMMMMGMDNNTNSNNKLRNMIRTNNTTAKSLLVLKTLCHYLRRGKKDSNNPTINNGQERYTNWTNESMYEDEDLSGVTPYEEQNDPIRTDIEESISKASACFTNCVLGGCITDPKLSIKTLWFHILSEVFDKGGDLYYQNQNNRNSSNGNSEIVVDNLTSLLVVLSQTHPAYVFDHSLQTDIIQWFKIFAVRFTKLLPMQANAVPLLNSTILAMTSCILEHDEYKTHAIKEGSELLVSGVTKEFISLLQQDVNMNRQKTQIEILQALMNWYGNDDFYPQLYNALNVSNAITLCLQSIASSAGAAAGAAGVNNNGINDTDIDEEQMTILSNSERFVEYKKQLFQQQQQHK